MDCDIAIIGAGILGLTAAHELLRHNPDLKISIIEKESEVGLHASGRNSGVIHAGFYYDADSLKAKFCRKGNAQLKEFCQEHSIPVLNSQKVVVAQSKEEISTIRELEQRGKVNGVEVQLVSESELKTIEPNAKTCEIALYSPSTSTVNPKLVNEKLKNILQSKGVQFRFNEKVTAIKDNRVIGNQIYRARHILNVAGMYADVLAKSCGYGLDFSIVPFKGFYLKYKGDKEALKTNIYPVPHPGNAFLGVHFTKSYDGSIKIGPTATPAFWRENYSGLNRFSPLEFGQVLSSQAKMFLWNSNNFRSLAIEEIRKMNSQYMISQALKLVHKLEGNFEVMAPGIRAQLFDEKEKRLVTDFVIEGNHHSTHVVNAVSPAFTCSFEIAKHLYSLIQKASPDLILPIEGA